MIGGLLALALGIEGEREIEARLVVGRVLGEAVLELVDGTEVRRLLGELEAARAAATALSPCLSAGTWPSSALAWSRSPVSMAQRARPASACRLSRSTARTCE